MIGREEPPEFDIRYAAKVAVQHFGAHYGYTPPPEATQ